MEDSGPINEVLEKWKVSGELELRKLAGLHVESWRNYFKQELKEIDGLIENAAEDAHERLITLFSFTTTVARDRPFIAAPFFRYFSDIKDLIHKIAMNLDINNADITIGFPFTIELTFNMPISRTTKG